MMCSSTVVSVRKKLIQLNRYAVVIQDLDISRIDQNLVRKSPSEVSGLARLLILFMNPSTEIFPTPYVLLLLT